MNIKNNKLNITIRFLVGLVFIISSIFKLLSIDSFEIYIYSFGILSLNTAFLFARFIISLELLAGILLIIGSYLQKVTLVSIIVLFIFSVFIGFLLLTNNQEHCHCFGDVIEISHVNSILKNIVLIAFLIIIYQSPPLTLKYSKLILLFSLILSLSLPFIISPPDSFSYAKYAKNVNYNDIVFKDFLIENNQYSKGKKVLCFFGTGCKFCKLATQKISVIANKLEDNDLINCVFWGTEESVNGFFKETNSTVFPYTFLPVDKFLRITNGQMPIIILLESGVVKGKYGYRDMNEQEIIDFMKD